jgi:hypothetical protein
LHVRRVHVLIQDQLRAISAELVFKVFILQWFHSCRARGNSGLPLQGASGPGNNHVLLRGYQRHRLFILFCRSQESLLNLITLGLSLLNYCLPVLDPDGIYGSKLFHFFWYHGLRLNLKLTGLSRIAFAAAGHLPRLLLYYHTCVNYRFLNVCRE